MAPNMYVMLWECRTNLKTYYQDMQKTGYIFENTHLNSLKYLTFYEPNYRLGETLWEQPQTQPVLYAHLKG